MTPRGALRSDARGAVSLELAVALLPVLALGAWVWHALELRAGELVVRCAAGAAARAAVVVLADDPAYYAGEAVGRFAGARKAQIELAAARVLASSAQLRSPRVELGTSAPGGALTARVSARFESWPAEARTLTASASAPLQGARYAY